MCVCMCVCMCARACVRACVYLCWGYASYRVTSELAKLAVETDGRLTVIKALFWRDRMRGVGTRIKISHIRNQKS